MAASTPPGRSWNSRGRPLLGGKLAAIFHPLQNCSKSAFERLTSLICPTQRSGRSPPSGASRTSVAGNRHATVLGRVKATRCVGALTRDLDPPCARRPSGGRRDAGRPPSSSIACGASNSGLMQGGAPLKPSRSFCHSPVFDPPEADRTSCVGAPRALMPLAEPSRAGRVKGEERSGP